MLTAPPERLVVMLYDGALRFLLQSAAAMRGGDRERARERMRRAEAIVDELNLVLDMEQGELPTRLRSIYVFCKRCLHEANIECEPHKIDNVIRLLSDLRDAWNLIATRSERIPA